MARQFGGDIPRVPTGTTSSNTSDTVEGGDGGSLTYSGSSSWSWDETSIHSSVVQSLSFNDFADSSGVYVSYGEGSGGIDTKAASRQDVTRLPAAPGTIYYSELQAGRGAMYRSLTTDLTTDGIPVDLTPARLAAIGPRIPRLVGSVLTDNVVSYWNFDAFFTSEGHEAGLFYSDSTQTQVLQSGFASVNNMSGPYDTTTRDIPFNDTISADYAKDYFYSYSNPNPYQETRQYTQALLGFNQNHAWNLSTATFISSGTYCAEGDIMSAVPGCVDFDVSVTWDHDASTSGSCRYGNPIFDCYGWPDDGSMTLWSDDATASFAFTPGGGTFTFDAGNGSDPFQTNLTP